MIQTNKYSLWVSHYSFVRPHVTNPAQVANIIRSATPRARINGSTELERSIPQIRQNETAEPRKMLHGSRDFHPIPCASGSRPAGNWEAIIGLDGVVV